jgi:hypothetical protein
VIIAVSTSSSSSVNIQWLVTDQLGTPRIIIDKTGSLAKQLGDRHTQGFSGTLDEVE